MSMAMQWLMLGTGHLIAIRDPVTYYGSLWKPFLYFVILRFFILMNVSCLWSSSFLEDLSKRLKATLNLPGIAERMRRIFCRSS